MHEAGSNSSQAKPAESCFHAPRDDPRGTGTCKAMAGRHCRWGGQQPWDKAREKPTEMGFGLWQLLERLLKQSLACTQGSGSLRNAGTLPQAPDTSLGSWLQAATAPLSAGSSRRSRADGTSTEPALLWARTPHTSVSRGRSKASPCLQGWKQPQQLDTQPGTHWVLGRGHRAHRHTGLGPSTEKLS